MDTCKSMKLNSDLSENVTYNTPEFPAYIRMEQLSLYPDYRGVSHWHDDVEFIMMVDGQMAYDINGQSIDMQTGEGVFVNSRCLHYGYSDAHADCHFICLRMSLSLLSANDYFTKNYLEPLTGNTGYPYQKLTPAILWQNTILGDIQAIYDTSHDVLRPFSVIEKFAHIMELLSENMDTQNKNVENSDNLLSLTAMIGFIQKNYPGKLLLKDISSAGNCCKTKCTSLFQRYLSVSPMQYLNNYRLEKGCAMLRNSPMSVTDVAYACGFSGTSYFCELFHRHYGITPNEYRRENL